MLQDVVSNYNEYLSYLVGTVFLTDNRFDRVKHKSKGYKFKGEYANQKGVEITLTGKTTVKAIRRQRDKINQQKQDKKHQKVHPHLRKWFNDKLRIDAVLATEFI